jgi:hypothetical protein
MSKNKSMMILLAMIGLLIAIPVMGSSKGSITISLDQSAYVDGNLIKPGKCEITWKSQSPEADVTIRNHGKRIDAHGKMVERDSASPYDEIVIQKDADGRDVIKEIKMQGKKSVLVID